MKFIRNAFYLVTFAGHNEAPGDVKPTGNLNVVGQYVGAKGRYLCFRNWFTDDLDESVETRANVLKKAIVKVKRLR